MDRLLWLWRRSCYMTLAALSILSAFVPLAAQTPLDVSPAEAMKHLGHRVGPEYPNMAIAARVQGTVVLKIVIGTDGHVIHMEPLSGPPMLITAACDAVREWTYDPFLHNGQAVTATTTVMVKFNINEAKDHPEIARFEGQLMECAKALRGNAKPEDAIAACQQAASLANSLSGPIYSDRRMAYIYYATALLRGQQAKEAAAVADKAISLMGQYHDNTAAAYAIGGQAKAVSGDLAGADRDLEHAEIAERKEIDTPVGRAERSTFTSTLKSLLQLHAQVLTALGRRDDAQKKLDEAAKL